MPLSAIGRVSFPAVYEATSMEEGQPKKFSLILIFDPENMDTEQKAKFSEMKAMAQKASIERFQCKIGEKPGGKGKPVANPFRKGSEKPDYYDEADIFIKFSSKKQPNVVDESRQAIGEGSADFYAGCKAHVSFTVYAYDVSGNRGVAFGLSNVQKTGDDEPFGTGATSAEDDFEVLAEPVGSEEFDDIEL